MEKKDPTPEDLQRKLYLLLEQLQAMAGELPPQYQMRVPTELLSGLANSLLNDTIFEIVKGLMDIQQVTERHLIEQRTQIEEKHKEEIQEMIIRIIDPEEQAKQKVILQNKHTEELNEIDMKTVTCLDQKVSDQQMTLENAGVPGFYITNKPIDIKVQMHLLDFILRLSDVEIP